MKRSRAYDADVVELTNNLLAAIHLNDEYKAISIFKKKYKKKKCEEVDEKGNTALLWAISKNMSQLAIRLIENGEDIEKPNNKNITPLIAAVKQCNYDIVKLLVEKGVDVNYVNRPGNPIFNVITTNNIKMFDILISSKKFNPNFKYYENNRNWYLSDLIYKRNIPMLNKVLNFDINLNPTDRTHPLLTAINNPYFPVIKLLIDKGADINSSYIIATKLLKYAILDKDLTLLLYLIDHKIKLSCILPVDEDNDPICFAIRLGKFTHIKKLIESNITTPSYVIMCAILVNNVHKFKAIILYLENENLLKKDQWKDLKCTIKAIPILSIAIKYFKNSIVNYLIEMNVALEIPNAFGIPPIIESYIVENNFAYLLLKKKLGSNINIKLLKDSLSKFY